MDNPEAIPLLEVSNAENLHANQDLSNIAEHVSLIDKLKGEYKPISPLDIHPIEHNKLFYGYHYIYPNNKITNLYLDKSINISFTETLEDSVIKDYRNPNVTYWRLGIPTPLYYRDDIGPGKYEEKVTYRQPEVKAKINAPFDRKRKLNNTVGYFNYVYTPSETSNLKVSRQGVVRHGLGIVKRRYPSSNPKSKSLDLIYIMYNYGIPTLIAASNSSILLRFDVKGFPISIYTNISSQLRFNKTIFPQSYTQEDNKTYSVYYFNANQPYFASLRIINLQTFEEVLFNVNIDAAGYSDFMYYQDENRAGLYRMVTAQSKGRFVDRHNIAWQTPLPELTRYSVPPKADQPVLFPQMSRRKTLPVIPDLKGGLISLYRLFTARNLNDLRSTIAYNLNLVEGFFQDYHTDPERGRYRILRFIWGDTIEESTLYASKVTNNNKSEISWKIDILKTVFDNRRWFPKDINSIIIGYIIPGDYNEYLDSVSKLPPLMTRPYL